ncbi:hypothetical protein GCM10010435_44380 [Winogradskya consettensis]|uniref:DUF4832 domain-containing protein n=1 Tax=Winogradskya consettensis TaxID=113560 RepID=A0A919SZX9_9ACTN|nr:DUF4832 domain-containing protein [Actinoplanes consettensis]GIM82688.1 hypothetical protein Aco04nite_82770 [Actinoplanes consettensis]
MARTLVTVAGGEIVNHDVIKLDKVADGALKKLLTADERANLTALGIGGYISTVLKTGSYSLILTDAGALVEVNSASAVTVTIPTAAAIAFPVGTVVSVLQYGVGQVTLAGAGGVTLRTPSTLTTRAQYSLITARKRSTNEWVVGGDLTVSGGGGGTPDPTLTTQTYTASTEIFPSPERGFFQYTETHYSGGSGFSALNTSTLQSTRTSLGRSLVFRYYVMEDMLGADTIPSAWLTALANDMTALRSAGCKMLPRFCYNTSGDYSQVTEPPLARILSHIDQIGNVLNANADVIHAVQMGFIGMWGEQYYTKTLGGAAVFGDVGSTNDTQKNNRMAVLSGLMSKLATSIYVQVRYVGLLRWAADAGLNMSRLGFHNDAIGSPDGDYGTYSTYNSQSEADARTYLINQIEPGRPHGGESASNNPPATDYPAMRSQMSAQHWSYLNPEYYGSVLAGWGSTNRDEVSRLLGYRLRLVSSKMPTSSAAGASVSVELVMANDGFGRVLSNRPLQVRFVNGGTTITRDLGYDVRTIPALSSGVTITGTVTAPTAGTWAVHLALPDPASGLAGNPAYAIQLANTGLWDGSTGRNSLARNLTVS